MLEETPFTPEQSEECLDLIIPTLPLAAQQNATKFILEFGTNLQRERLLYHFPRTDDPVSNQNVLAALTHYQNDDGGFGHGLEADLRTKHSTVLATTVGLQILESVNALQSSEADRALKFLISNFSEGTWQAIHEHANDLPHAPWWKFSDEKPGFQANPSAEVLRYLISRNVMATETPGLLDEAIRYITETPLEMHELLCYVQLYETLYEGSGLSHDQRIALLPYMLSNGFRLVNTEPLDWEEYCLTPLSVITHPKSIFAEFFADVVPTNFQFLIDTQNPDGSWSPNWSWAGEFPATWRVVETEIKAEITLKHLLKFDKFSGLEAGDA